MIITKNKIEEVLKSFSGPATVYEICGKIDAFASWERERVFSILNKSKGFQKVPVESLCRNFESGNHGVVKWAYKLG